MSRKAVIQAIATHLPERTLSNEELAAEFGNRWSAEKIHAKTGILTRGVAAPGECASDLGVAAAQKLLDGGAVAREDVDFLLFCTQSPDYFLPATACTMQSRLGLRSRCGALDFNQGCSGFVYGLSLAKGLIESGSAGNVLLVTAETYSKHIHPKDASTRVLFGDGAAAVLVGAQDAQVDRIGPFVFGTDGHGACELAVPAGAFRCPPGPETVIESADNDGNIRTPQNLYMNGPEIFNFTLRTIPSLVSTLLHEAGLEKDAVDYYVFHQANRFMLEHLRRKIGIPDEKFCINLESYGNTVSATIPMALEIALARGDVRPGARVMVVGFGVGYSWAAALLSLI